MLSLLSGNEESTTTESMLGLTSENNNLTHFDQIANVTSDFNQADPIQSIHDTNSANQLDINTTNLALSDETATVPTLPPDFTTDLI